MQVTRAATAAATCHHHRLLHLRLLHHPLTSSTIPSLQTYVEELVEKHKDQIVETTGEQGDLLVMHPLLVHAPSDALRCTLMEKEVRAATAISTTTTSLHLHLHLHLRLHSPPLPLPQGGGMTAVRHGIRVSFNMSVKWTVRRDASRTPPAHGPRLLLLLTPLLPPSTVAAARGRARHLAARGHARLADRAGPRPAPLAARGGGGGLPGRRLNRRRAHHVPLLEHTHTLPALCPPVPTPYAETSPAPACVTCEHVLHSNIYWARTPRATLIHASLRRALCGACLQAANPVRARHQDVLPTADAPEARPVRLGAARRRQQSQDRPYGAPRPAD